MSALILVLFWIIMAVFADVLPIRDPLAQSAPDLLKPCAFARPRRRHLLARHRRQGTRHSLATDLRFAARALLVDLATVVAYAVGMLMGVCRRLSRRLVGRDHLLHRQHLSRLPADGALHRHPVAISARIRHWARCSARCRLQQHRGQGPHHHHRHHASAPRRR